MLQITGPLTTVVTNIEKMICSKTDQNSSAQAVRNENKFFAIGFVSYYTYSLNTRYFEAMALDISVIVGSILMAIGGLLVLIGLILCYTTKVRVFCCYWWFILNTIETEK